MAEKKDAASSRFTAPTGFNSPKTARAIDGLKPGDKGYMEAWSKKNGIPYEEVTKSGLSS
jgi:hypothetical protein